MAKGAHLEFTVDSPNQSERRRGAGRLMFRLEVLAADEGDCLWIEYGDSPHIHRMIVDGGPARSYAKSLRRRIAQLPSDERTFELLIVTHVDGDHIGGALSLLRDPELGVRFNEIWFNGYRHLTPPGLPAAMATARPTLGPVDGERLTAAIWPFRATWNRAFRGGTVAVPSRGPLPKVVFAGGLDVTVLSPTNAQLLALRPKWETIVRAAGLIPGTDQPAGDERRPMLGKRDPVDPRHADLMLLASEPAREDTAEANGSSIAVALEYQNRRIVLGADAHPGVLAAGLERAARDLSGVEGPLPVDVFKVPHHGSKSNVTKELLGRVQCSHYVVSTSGSYHEHPDAEAIARLVVEGGIAPTVYFNYDSARTEPWLDPDLQARYGFQARAAPDRDPGIALDLI